MSCTNNCGLPLSCTAVRCTHAHSHSPLSRGFRCGGNWHTKCRKAGRSARGMGDARATTRRTKQAKTDNVTRALCSLPVPGNPVPPKGPFQLSHTRVEASKPSAKRPAGTKNYSYGRAKAATSPLIELRGNELRLIVALLLPESNPPRGS